VAFFPSSSRRDFTVLLGLDQYQICCQLQKSLRVIPWARRFAAQSTAQEARTFSKIPGRDRPAHFSILLFSGPRANLPRVRSSIGMTAFGASSRPALGGTKIPGFEIRARSLRTVGMKKPPLEKNRIGPWSFQRAGCDFVARRCSMRAKPRIHWTSGRAVQEFACHREKSTMRFHRSEWCALASGRPFEASAGRPRGTHAFSAAGGPALQLAP